MRNLEDQYYKTHGRLFVLTIDLIEKINAEKCDAIRKELCEVKDIVQDIAREMMSFRFV